ncbi:MAG: GGDEF domain-containing protein [Oscillospiraceae bacterium]|nr:GGDEF domain-containing protein [Oscillospiraceae bacterium]
MNSKNFYLEDAMRILTETYHKILKINLSADTHIDIKVYKEEQNSRCGYSEKISQWLRNFALSGQIFEKDVEQYLRFTDIENIKKHFEHSDDCLRLRYRRRTNEKFRWVMMELLKASDYTADNQTVMLYIQDIHDTYISEMELQKELEYLCKTDTMTGLKNMYSYRMLCDTVLAETSPRPIGVLFADLNGLKVVNDTMGHDKGNEYICRFSNMLSESFGKYENFRISGDEFITVSIGDSEEDFRANAENFKLLINKNEPPIASVGFYWDLSNSINAVSAESEMRMYENKQEFYERYPEYKHSAVEQSYHDEMSSLIQVLTDSYEVLLIADLDKDTYHIIKQNTSSIKAGEPSVGIYSERNDNFCADYISEDFRELRRKVGSISNLKVQLKNEIHIICDYRLKNGQWRESSFWKIDSKANGEPTKIIYYSQGIDRSMTERISHRRKAEKDFEIMARLNEVYRSISVINLETERLHLYQNITLPDSIASFFEQLSI